MKKLALLVLMLAASASPALADSCEQECPDGKVRISYADGNHVECQCVDPGEGMQPNSVTEDDMTEADYPQEGQS